MPDYDFKKIEKKWSEKWLKDKIYEPDLDKAQKPFYNLTMFPYPSAEGLHVGNMYDMVGCDIFGRFKRMQGFDVFQPIGLDGFGIHSENYALKINKHPKELSKITERRFYEQIKTIGAGFAWDERLETYDPEYYKWTQWIFVQMFKKGLAYRKKATVNWCGQCLTVLADEQVLAGECERCGTEVIKKELEQWFFKITEYAERLLNDLDKIDWSEQVKTAQRNWIGKSEGALVKFTIPNLDVSRPSWVEVFTTRPDTLFGATYVVLSPEHELIKNLKLKIKNWDEVEEYIKNAKKKTNEERIAEKGDKTGIELKGLKAINPATKEEIPVWVADYVLAGYGTGAIMAVPAHDQRDFEFAKKYDLPIKIVICSHYPETTCPILDSSYGGEGHLVASGDFDGISSQEARKKITEFVGGKTEVKYHLRDWLISRQRYWGLPIPMIYWKKCDWQPVPEKDLPVLLPDVKDFRPTGTDKSPLATVEEFVKIKCPECGGEAKRETDVSDTFLDSAWYFFRYIDHKNKKEPFGKSRAKHWLPVDRYMGGFEHAVLHLLYTRFITLVFNDWGLIDFSAEGGSASGGDDPFKKFRAHGHITKDGAKMSKSRGNVVNPDEWIERLGADVLRMYLMFIGPYEQGGDWRDESIAGIDRFLNRVWNLARKSKEKNKGVAFAETETILHQSIKKIGEDIEKLHYNTAISQLMILLNALESGCDEKNFKIFLKLLAPFAPFVAEELWDEKTSIHKSKWPEYDESKIKEKTKIVIVQVNGRVRDKFEMPSGASDEEIEKEAVLKPKIKKILGDIKPKKVVVAKNHLVNIVLAK